MKLIIDSAKTKYQSLRISLTGSEYQWLLAVKLYTWQLHSEEIEVYSSFYCSLVLILRSWVQPTLCTFRYQLKKWFNNKTCAMRLCSSVIDT